MHMGTRMSSLSWSTSRPPDSATATSSEVAEEGADGSRPENRQKERETMPMITVRNELHNSQCRLRLRGKIISVRQLARCRAALCIDGCGGALHERGPAAIRDREGNCYVAKVMYDSLARPYGWLEQIDEPAA